MSRRPSIGYRAPSTGPGAILEVPLAALTFVGLFFAFVPLWAAMGGVDWVNARDDQAVKVGVGGVTLFALCALTYLGLVLRPLAQESAGSHGRVTAARALLATLILAGAVLMQMTIVLWVAVGIGGGLLGESVEPWIVMLIIGPTLFVIATAGLLGWPRVILTDTLEEFHLQRGRHL